MVKKPKLNQGDTGGRSWKQASAHIRSINDPVDQGAVPQSLVIGMNTNPRNSGDSTQLGKPQKGQIHIQKH